MSLSERLRRHAALAASCLALALAHDAALAQAGSRVVTPEWRDTADALKALMQQWKDAPRSGRAEEDELWKRFRGAQDVFFARRSEQFAERDAEQEGNKALKEAIIAEADSIQAARAALDEFPLAKAGLIAWDVIPLGPFTNWELLFAPVNA